MTLYDRAFVTLAGSPRGAGTLDGPAITVRKSNPLCGDEIELDVRLDGKRIGNVAHRTKGCAIAHASAALLAELAPGLEAEGARALAGALEAALARRGPLPEGLQALAEVRLLPSRRRCALLPWSALLEALGPIGTDGL